EITESVFASDFDEINRLIGRLRNHGIKIAIDDFGTGYSSLAKERELNIDYLKIDRRFIENLTISDPKNLITSDIISIAHKLGHIALAEGVETKEQKDYLYQIGCDMIQGFLISKAIDINDALKLLALEEDKMLES
ncbi:MAG: EAL domain-containing protein, partial [Erysipelotrichaceae bacterium]|nr:EAL domain-containing protein [Erysipelotrichaceae bacterium]